MSFTVYSMEGCGHCVGAKAALTIKKIPFDEIKVPQDMTTADFIKRYPNARSFPLIFDGDHLVGGFKDLQDYLLSRELGGMSI